MSGNVKVKYTGAIDVVTPGLGVAMWKPGEVKEVSKAVADVLTTTNPWFVLVTETAGFGTKPKEEKEKIGE